MDDLRNGIEHLKQAKAHMSKANRIMSDHISKLKALEDENFALKAKLELTCMELPIDADGVPIRIGDKMDVDGDCMNVLGYRLYDGELLLVVKKAEGDCTFYTPKPSSVRHYKYSKLDSWEKLENDAKKTSCGYASAPRDENGLTTCEGCRFQKTESCSQEMMLDVLKRAKKLAGIEESEEASDD
jgi:hypothetical protein